MTATEERVEGHYEVEEVPYGRVYKWTPAQTGTVEVKPLVEDEVYYPEHRAYEEWHREEEAHPYLRHYEWMEWQALE